MKTIAAVANVYNEANALPGWLECVTSWADDIQIYHAGPGGAWSNDGTMEILKAWGIPVHRGSIDDGFGVVRTATVRATKCDWAVLLDADERFWGSVRVMGCSGEDTPPDQEGKILAEYTSGETGCGAWQSWESVRQLGQNLRVTFAEVYNQIDVLRDVLKNHTTIDAVQTIRRHWHDFTFKRPTQNWMGRPDCQARIVRNHPAIHWDPNKRMHESLIGADNIYQANMKEGPFFDHYHMWFKRMEPEQRRFDLQVYDALHEGRTVPAP